MNRRLVIIWSVIAMLVIFSSAWIANNFFRIRYQEKTAKLYQKTLMIQSDLISKSIRSHILVDDFVNSRVQLERLKVEGRLKKYLLKSSDGRVKLQSETTDTANCLYAKIDLYFKDDQGDKWGSLEMWFPSEEFNETLRMSDDHSNRSFLLNVILILILFMFSVVAFDRSTMPLEKVVTGLFDESPAPNKGTHRLVDLIWEPFLHKIQLKSQELKALKKANDELKIASIISKISQNLAHDMRAPLGTFETLLAMPPNTPLSSQFPIIKSSVRRLHSMIQSLLRADLELHITRSNALLDVRQSADSVLKIADSKRIKFSIMISNEPVIIFMDHSKVERAWINLATNALDFAVTTVKVKFNISGKDLVIQVIDDGIGVPEEFQPKLFQRGATYGKQDGTGLGLAYVRQIMRGHGGDVTYRRENNMTVFECYLPNAVTEVATDTTRQSPPQDIAEACAPQKTIAKQVSICFVSPELNQRVFDRLSNISQESYSFLLGPSQESEIVLTDSEEVADKLPDQKVRPLLFNSLSDDEIVRRAPIRLGIKG